MILVDSNIPMYLVGEDHPNKERARSALGRLAVAGERLVSDAEVLQEILHRYLAIRRKDAIDPALETLIGLTREIFAVTVEDVMRARRLVGGSSRLSARDAIHVAVMERTGVTRILSFDRGFDAVPGIQREA